MHVHNTVNVYMLTYCFTYVVLKLYVHHDNNVRLIYYCDITQRLLLNTAKKKELYGSNTCYNNKNFISKLFYKRMNYSNKKLYWITDKTIIIFLNEGLEEIEEYNHYNRIPFNKYINSIYKYYCNKLNIKYNDLIKSKNNIKLNNDEIKLLDQVYSKYCI